ncbi:glycosyltransferase [Leptospira levettii]|uniref:Glycosyltransferase n=1 Tax=Leptospira levettii TaxID=2023178 RepID=A0ABY2MP38_9LEPT|nr:glycosyltransferase [Leptospira levettii]TGL71505.1 glycosyltransferase [Leptospira levettii]TGM24628.1 glycosyltransferase [Leptospira levettii]TGM86140.1 glycosyltransferase [Leptospira levettii]
MKNNHLSIVIPCYRELNRLPNYIESLISHFQFHTNIDFIIVDDGSPKNEFHQLKEKLELSISNSKLQLFHYEINLGKGGAISYGIAKSKGNYLGFIDADGATPAYEVERIWNYVNNNQELDLVIGSRIPMFGRKVSKSFYRHIANRMFSYYFNQIFKIQIYDPQCGCKIFKKSNYEIIKSKITDLRWLWDTQLTVLFYRNQFKISEFPIDWNQIPESKFSFFKDSLAVLYSVWKYRNIK